MSNKKWQLLEYVSSQLRTWPGNAVIGLIYIQPGKSKQIAYVERYNTTVRSERLGLYHFDNIEEMQDHATRKLRTYNGKTQITVVGWKTSIQKLKAA